MRKVSLVVAAVLVLGITWQVADAQSGNEPVALCVRPGTDVRTPSSNGSCPSGYTKVEVSQNQAIPASELIATTTEIPFEVGTPRCLALSGITSLSACPGTPVQGQVIDRQRTFTELLVDVRPIVRPTGAPISVEFNVQWQPAGSTDVILGANFGCTVEIAPTGTLLARQQCRADDGDSSVVPAGSLVWILMTPRGTAGLTGTAHVSTALS
jgi:hypothetical protein